MSFWKTRRRKQENTQKALNSQMRFLIIGISVPFIMMILFLFYILGTAMHEYNTTLQNVTTVSELNMDFKDNLDLDMYYYVVESHNMDHLPMKEVIHAESVLKRLEQTTTDQENRWRIQSMRNLCQKLKQYMREIESTDSYAERMEMLETNIYIITDLIATYMHEYIYVEVHSLNRLQDEIRAQIMIYVLAALVIGVLLILWMMRYSIQIVHGISRTVDSLCRKVEQIGSGDFAVAPIRAPNRELQTLDNGFNRMATQIKQLLKHVKEDQKALSKAEFQLLQAQINPHFLYNTFDSIIWLAEMHQDERVIEMTTNLSSFFRNSLSRGQDIIPLETEKHQVESYLRIQQIRYQDILSYSIEIPDYMMHYVLPKLTLQPLVENALYHGIKNKRGGGCIHITAQETEREICICVKDNGAGMDETQLEQLRASAYENKSAGWGLFNVHQRLRIYFGGDAGLRFKSELGQGTEVTVHLSKQSKLSL